MSGARSRAGMSESAAPSSEPAAKVVDAEPARPVSDGVPRGRGERARSAAYRTRFALVYVGLAVIAGIGVGALVVLLARPAATPPARWSAWVPTGSDSAKASQIADVIAKRYRLDNGQQLAAALVGPPQVTSGGAAGGQVPVRAIAIKPDTSKGKQEATDIAIHDAQNSLMIILCGLGQSCSIKGGKATVARHALLQREALELALYTFKYVGGVNAVTVFLPPRPNAAASSGTSIYLRKADLSKELQRPLARTLGPVAPRIGKMPKFELQALNRITRPHLYTYEYQQAQDGSAVLVLNPVLGA